MRTRTVREGSTGLLILLGIALFGALGLWLRGFNPSNRSYKAVVTFASARGIQVGTVVRYRGVDVGKISRISPSSNGVDVEIQIASADLIIPKDVVVEAGQTGLIGETFIDILPQREVPTDVTTGPLDRNCNESLIVCNGTRLAGRSGPSVDELIRTSIRFTNQFSDPSFVENIKAATRNTAAATASIARLSNQLGGLTQSVRQEAVVLSRSAQITTRSISRAADEFGLTANQINGLLVENRSQLVGILDNLALTSTEVLTATRSLGPSINRLGQGELIRNLEQLSANALQASANLRDVSKSLNDPTTIVQLQRTLDSARVTFENTQKITSDLDELTGDPAFRNNLRNLVNGLSDLVSSTQQLQDQIQVAQTLSPGKTLPTNLAIEDTTNAAAVPKALDTEKLNPPPEHPEWTTHIKREQEGK
ncbi:MAG: MlaD family protein [Leptolyngbyaceae cyanobacterium bins.59]|nr:MlaD family protein [Leptolyngbyaceae cyanobacterium bins.59]